MNTTYYFPFPETQTNLIMSTSNVVSAINLSEILPKLDDGDLRTFLETGVLPNPLPEPKAIAPKANNDVLPTCPSEVYSFKYQCCLPGWVYKMGYDI